jgi:hypothetical protein
MTLETQKQIHLVEKDLVLIYNKKRLIQEQKIKEALLEEMITHHINNFLTTYVPLNDGALDASIEKFFKQKQ